MTYKTINGQQIPVYDSKDLMFMINLIQKDGRGVNDWEKVFVESVKQQLGLGKNLSDKQISILDRIYTEKTI
jgi:hypothetical protein